MSEWQEATDSISIATGAAYCYVYKDWRIKKIKTVSEKQVLYVFSCMWFLGFIHIQKRINIRHKKSETVYGKKGLMEVGRPGRDEKGTCSIQYIFVWICPYVT